LPLIDLTYPQGALGDEARAEATEKMTAALLRIEGAPDNPATRAMSRVFVHELPPEHVYVGGAPAPLPTYRAVVTAPAGTLLHGPGPVGVQQREQLVRELTEIILAAEGTEYGTVEAGRVFCLIHEVTDGYWGGMGTIFRMADIAAFADGNLPQTETAAAARLALAESETAPSVPAGGR
jgi:phenylpyruvate tautomerase PptA (4-oxalocrotonate tautomerase family)